MRNIRPLSFLLALPLVAGLTACGGGNRQLQSITISAVTGGGQVSFVATGTFNTSPKTVTPLPVSWYFGDPSGGYSLSTQPFVFSCSEAFPAGRVNAIAPADPHAPNIGSVSGIKIIAASAALVCQ